MSEHLTRTLVLSRWPHARAAFLAGSAAAGDAHSTSDLDVVVLLPEPGPVMRETVAGPVELFVNTETSWHAIVDAETALRRSPLLHMCATGVVVVDHDGLGARLQQEARRRWAEGPPPLADEEREDHRYGLTDLIDDLVDARDPDERLAVAARVLVATGELSLLQGREWLGTGKWLVKRWSAADAGSCRAVFAAFRALAATGDPAPLAAAAGHVLATAGGPAGVGYRRVRSE